MRLFRVVLAVSAALAPVAMACVSNSAPPVNLTSDGGGLGSSGSGSGSSSGSSSGGSSSGGSSGGSSSGSSSGGEDSGADGSSFPASCTYVVTGANASTGGCDVVVAYNSPKLILGLSASGSNPEAFVFSSDLSTTANFAPGTFTSANVVYAEGDSIDISGAGVPTWAEDFNFESKPNQGSFSLTITATGPQSGNGDGGVAWGSPHGSLTVTMLPENDAGTGTLTGTATF